MRWLEILLRPRLRFLHQQVLFRRVSGGLIMTSGLLLLLPLPVPLTNSCQRSRSFCWPPARWSETGSSFLPAAPRSRDARLLRPAGLWGRASPRQPAAQRVRNMKARHQTQPGAEKRPEPKLSQESPPGQSWHSLSRLWHRETKDPPSPNIPRAKPGTTCLPRKCWHIPVPQRPGESPLMRPMAIPARSGRHRRKCAGEYLDCALPVMRSRTVEMETAQATKQT